MVRRPLFVIAALGLALSGFWASPAAASTRGVITGTVTDATGSPVAGAVIQYHALGGEYDQASTDVNGVYRLRVQAPVHAYLDVYDDLPYPIWTSGDISFDAKATVVQDVTLPGVGVPTMLYGQVTDAKTGKPVSRLRISSLIHEGDNDSEAYTDQNGWYAFTEYDAQGEGYHPLSGTFTYDLFTEVTSKHAAVSYNEEDPTAAGPGVVVSEGQKVRFDFAVPRL
ncbi:MAG TPA: carboxypeptidase-like regulatory domain-containing protein [Kineosporiaceae bacterium]|nr:carboxypeptidase-like regulatory domain-containing protein [Kineosporiaceae bacterium]